MNDPSSWMPAIGICSIIAAVAILMIAVTLHQIQEHLAAIRAQDTRLNDLTEQALRQKIEG